ncbi:ABC transporter permease [Salipiger aestuarii]|uniref:Peptide/nickel transport system permease protein n=1 Tax=Salipiger aestuarii TaxID=568098 RepID=A0A327YIU5_9RHOB|nr:ABC transporter permease [Salipiger aestuarii]EIE50386.1 putative transport system permease ABC transporter protein [Citreicella sp. 357]KAA8609339.1 ABC transporter permease [Salipiger aestuarii]KAB2542951.1 ABC transporter permease [Salipiger aestuarii]RAK20880.1 peptide/nickel transport system permease protein [Salipiger aestuarii]
MRWFAIKSLRAFVTLWLVVTFVFFVLRLSGDPTMILLPDDTDAATRSFYRALWGLDRPIWDQYLRYVAGLMQGDFGISFRNNMDAFQLVRDRVPKTALLGWTALSIALVLGIPLGILAALYRDSWIDRVVMGLAVFGFSMPNFFLGILLILIFSLQLRWLPSSGSDTWWHLIMPAFTLGTGFAAQIARYTRSSMIDVLAKPYMRTARSTGAGPARRVISHALPNAAVPVVTILGFQIGQLLGWAVVTETVFAWPGIGRLLTTAVATRDLAVVQCIMILLAITMIAANMFVDFLYGWLDPRVRVGAGARTA